MSASQTPNDLGQISGSDFLQILQVFHAALKNHESEINALNVFPVPDSDTGTNSLLTVAAGIAGLASFSGDRQSLRDVIQCFAQLASADARGNSGTILAEYFRGLALELSNAADATNWQAGLQMAARCAREAVLTPQEGTMLSVASAIALVPRPNELFAYLGDVTHVAKLALLETTNQLATLSEAQVVDAGACVLVLFHESVSSFLNSHPMNISFASDESSVQISPSYFGPKFEVTLCLNTEQDAREMLKSVLAELGESITIAGASPEFKVHIHTDSVEQVLAKISTIGEVSKIFTTTLPEFAPKS